MSLADRITWDLEVVKNFLRVDHNADDLIITNLVLSAIGSAENYIQTDFTGVDASGNTVEKPVPSEVWTWVLARVARRYERRPEGLSTERSAGGASTIWGPEEFEDLKPLRKYPWL